MIAEFKPYSDYKESGLSWLGKVPKHWEMRPAFGAYEPILDRNRGMKEKTVLSLSYGRIIIKPAEKLHGLVPESFETYQIVNPGDIVLRTIDLQNDHTSLRVGTVRDRGIITSAYLALRVKAGVSADFGYQFLNVWDMSKAIYGYGSGLRQNLDFTHFKRMPVPLPPSDEQAAIVRFLDHVNHRLERTIRAKRKVIALLNEQKQAIIHRAVTRGLDPDVPLRPSGIPWLENIPKHWKVCALKRVCRRTSLYGANIPAAKYVESGVRFLRTTDISERGELQEKAVFVSDYDASGYLLDEGDFLISRSGTVGRAFVYRADTHGACAYAGYLVRFVLRQEDLLPEFMWCFTKTPAFAAFLKSAVIASTIENVNGEKYGNMPVALPPVAEQRSILSFIGKRSAPLDTAMTRLDREIALLREYRTRLIADVVTGKLDVREAARNLPEEAETLAVEDGVIEEDGNDEVEEAEEA